MMTTNEMISAIDKLIETEGSDRHVDLLEAIQDRLSHYQKSEFKPITWHLPEDEVDAHAEGLKLACKTMRIIPSGIKLEGRTIYIEEVQREDFMWNWASETARILDSNSDEA